MITGKKILIAGGNGFIGTNLCLKLKRQNNDIVIVDNFSTSESKFVYWYKKDVIECAWDIVNPLKYCSTYKFSEDFDIIINLACPASPPDYQKDPIHTLDTCYIGTKNLLDMMNKKTIFLQASTSEIYGDSLYNEQCESDRGNVNCFGPRACYDEGKRVAETLCYEKIKLGYNVKIMRIFNTYGPHMKPDDGRVVTNLLSQCIEQKPFTIYGEGNQTRSFQYIDDLLNGIELLLESNLNEPVNLGNPNEITINKLIEIIKQEFNLPDNYPLNYVNLPKDDPTHRRPDITLAKEKLGYLPKIDIREGLNKTYNYLYEKTI
jgi:UDP-glucuronate decarboxylase